MDLSTREFLHFDQLIAPPPFPAISALLLLLGTVYLGKCLARCIRGNRTNVQDLAAGFVVATGLLGAALHLMALAQMIPIMVLRCIGSLLVIFGLIETVQFWRKRNQVYRAVSQFVLGLYAESRFTFIILAAISIGIFLAIWGPVSDIDSLDYHLGVPLDWIRHGGAFPRFDWFHARLVGIGEMINMLGLAMGSDCVGAGFQASGLVVAFIALGGFAKTTRDLLFAGSAVLACPMIVFLAFSQKPQLLPCAATSLALVMILKRFRTLDRSGCFLILSCLWFALGCKYSFIFSAIVILPIAFMAVRKSGLRASAMILPFLMFLILAGSVYIRNYAFYGDPISPMMERWKKNSDPDVLRFAEFLRGFGGDRSPSRLIRLPWHLIATRHPFKWQTVLGVGVLAFLLLSWNRIEQKIILIAALAVTVLTIVFGQLTARFFYEPYLWCAAAAVGTTWKLPKRLMLRLLSLQAIIVAGTVGFAVITFFPAALTSQQRHSFMNKTAEGYAASIWMDNVLPKESIIVAETRAALLMPRPFVSIDLARFRNSTAGTAEIAQRLRMHGVTELVLLTPMKISLFENLSDYLASTEITARFLSTGRNPFMRGPYYELTVYKPNWDTNKALLQR